MVYVTFYVENSSFLCLIVNDELVDTSMFLDLSKSASKYSHKYSVIQLREPKEFGRKLDVLQPLCSRHYNVVQPGQTLNYAFLWQHF